MQSQVSDSPLKIPTQLAFDKGAKSYDDNAKFQRKIGEELFSRIEGLCPKGDTATDLGCGTGTLASSIATSRRFKNVIAIDISHEMLKMANLKQKEFSCVQGSVTKLPLKKKSADLIASNLMLQWIDEAEQFFCEVNRSLKNDGIFMATLLGEKTFCELRKAMTQALTKNGKGEDLAVFHPFINEKEIVATAKRAGLHVKVEKRFYTCVHESGYALLKMLKGIGAQNNLGLHSMGLGRRQVMKSFNDYYKKHFPSADGGVCVTYEVIFLTANLSE